MIVRLALIALWCLTLHAHAPLLPAIVGPVEARGNQLVDVGTGLPVVLRGVTLDEPSATSFGVIRVRWNLNAVRLPVNLATWRQDADRIVADVQAANSQGLLVIVVAKGNELPSDDALAFWTEFATRLRANARVMFSLFDEPSARSVPGSSTGIRTTEDWRFWLSGGTARDGSRVVGMQTMVDAIRAAGARQQLIAVPAYHDALGFQGLAEDQMIRGANIVYEAHPSFAFGAIDALFRPVASRAPVYAGDWGLGADCAGLSRDPQNVAGVVNQALTYFDAGSVSWTASPFRTGGLVTDFISYAPTTLGSEVACPGASGMGELLLLWTTGDPGGFGMLSPSLVANSAGGLPGPIAPGELLTLYVEQLGPAAGAAARLSSDGKLPVNIEGAEVRFDGVPVPLLFAGAFQLNVQVPYNLRPGTQVNAQVFYRGVPSNLVKIDVAESAPELFQDPATRYALALNEDGTRNGPTRPARSGSIVVLFASGGGQTSPTGLAGAPSASPHPRLTLPASVTVDGQSAEVLFAGEVPGYFGLLQVNAKLPGTLSGGLRPAPVTLKVGTRPSASATLIWVAP
jgi:uncharacterized protein (TIGR03437 family)